jgi:hypothetical protein
MAGVLHLPAAGGQALVAGLQARSAALRGLDGPGVTVDTSDQVWADPSLITQRSYLNAVATSYDAGIAHVPLLRSPDQAAQEISQAIATATHGQIPQLPPPGSLQDIGWLLTDALYLNAAWAAPFQASQTGPAPFTTVGGQTVSARYMNGGPYPTASADGWTAVWQPYRGGRLAMMALLSPAGAGGCPLPAASQLRTMTTALTAGGTGTGRSALDHDVALPKVTVTDKVSMKGLLTQLGERLRLVRVAELQVQHVRAHRVGRRSQLDDGGLGRPDQADVLRAYPVAPSTASICWPGPRGPVPRPWPAHGAAPRRSRCRCNPRRAHGPAPRTAPSRSACR